jgi:hypothetical protein
MILRNDTIYIKATAKSIALLKLFSRLQLLMMIEGFE